LSATGDRAMSITYGILLFDGVEELDFAGPLRGFNG
jgi:hypothetical protein